MADSQQDANLGADKKKKKSAGGDWVGYRPEV